MAFDEEDDGTLPDRVTKEPGEHMIGIKSIFTDSVITDDEKAEILLLGESVPVEVNGEPVLAVQYNNKVYVSDPRYGLLKL